MNSEKQINEIVEHLKNNKENFLLYVKESFNKYIDTELQMLCWGVNKSINVYINTEPDKSQASGITTIRCAYIMEKIIYDYFKNIFPIERPKECDFIINLISLEMKTNRYITGEPAPNFQGTTHSVGKIGKVNDYILITLEIDQDIIKTPNDNILKGIGMCIIKTYDDDWKGVASKNNSRTTLNLLKERRNEYDKNLIFGTFKDAIKYIKLIPEKI